jgi:putative transposase
MMGLARSTFYAKPSRSPKNSGNLSDFELREQIEHLHVDFPGYGYRRIYHALLKTGMRINAKRIRRVMSEHSLKPIVYRTFKVATTDSAHNHRIYPNLLKGKKTSDIDEVWVTDLTYIRLNKEFIYLAAILDRHSRKVIGWALSKSLRKEVCLAALQDAIAKRNPPKGCIHHSDRGVQYACDQYVKILKENGFQISMSAKGNPYDNAHMESFFKSLKYEEVHLYNYDDFANAITRLPHYIDELYNQRRLHSSLGYCSPAEFEEDEKRRKNTSRDIDNRKAEDQTRLNCASTAVL